MHGRAYATYETRKSRKITTYECKIFGCNTMRIFWTCLVTQTPPTNNNTPFFHSFRSRIASFHTRWRYFDRSPRKTIRCMPVPRYRGKIFDGMRRVRSEKATILCRNDASSVSRARDRRFLIAIEQFAAILHHSCSLPFRRFEARSLRNLSLSFFPRN